MAKGPPSSMMGKSLGILVLVAAQILIGAIHVVFGLWLLTGELAQGVQATIPYDVYTVVFGGVDLVFAFYLWRCSLAGWIGTVAVSIFVIVVDSLAVLNLPTIPGVPQGPAAAEIIYSLLIVGYLSSNHVRRKFLG